MSKCEKCGVDGVGYMKYHCYKCKNELAGMKPRKHRKLCYGCINDFYNQKYQSKNAFGGKGCMSYKGNNVVIKDVYFSTSQVVPNPKWKLECFNYKRN